MRIGILEDDELQTAALEAWLDADGHRCVGFTTVAEFMKALRRDTFDLLIVDWNLPDGSGLDALVWVRETLGQSIPVLFATSRDGEEDLVTALQKGADDYLTKPLREHETRARIKALGRRALGESPEARLLEYAPYLFDLENTELKIDNEPVKLTHMEFQLALFLFRHSGQLLSRNHILESVWGRRGDVPTRTVDTHISRLRSKLALGSETGWRLSAIYQHGYRLERVGQEAATQT